MYSEAFYMYCIFVFVYLLTICVIAKCQGFENAISILYQNNKFPNNCVTVK